MTRQQQREQRQNAVTMLGTFASLLQKGLEAEPGAFGKPRVGTPDPEHYSACIATYAEFFPMGQVNRARQVARKAARVGTPSFYLQVARQLIAINAK